MYYYKKFFFTFENNLFFNLPINKLKQILLKNFYLMVLITLSLAFLTNCEAKKKEDPSIECYNRSRSVNYQSAKNLPVGFNYNQEYFYGGEDEYYFDLYGNQTKNIHYDSILTNGASPTFIKDLDNKTITIKQYDTNPVRNTKEDKKRKGFECAPKNGNLIKSGIFDKNNYQIIEPGSINYLYTYNDKGDKLTTLEYNSNSTQLLSVDIYTYTYNYNNDWLTKTKWSSNGNSTNYNLWNYVYDSRGLVTTEINSTKYSYANAWTVSKTYNTHNKAGDIIWKSTITAGSDSNDVTYYTYWPNGILNVEWQTFKSGNDYSYIRKEYDTYGLPALIFIQSSFASKFIANFNFKYDSNGNILEITYFNNDKWQSKTGYENYDDKGNAGKEINYKEDGSILFYILYEYTKR